jgi:hypothetical protein
MIVTILRLFCGNYLFQRVTDAHEGGWLTFTLFPNKGVCGFCLKLLSLFHQQSTSFLVTLLNVCYILFQNIYTRHFHYLERLWSFFIKSKIIVTLAVRLDLFGVCNLHRIYDEPVAYFQNYCYSSPRQ